MKYLWTTINVENLDESISFYSDLARLQLLQRFPAGPGTEIAFMGNGQSDETLVELLADSSIGAVSHNDFLSIGFAVCSVSEMMQRVKNSNIPIYSGPIETPGSIFFSIKDPDGLTVQFFEQKQDK